jgi:thiol:disulfide interchange protein
MTGCSASKVSQIKTDIHENAYTADTFRQAIDGQMRIHNTNSEQSDIEVEEQIRETVFSAPDTAGRQHIVKTTEKKTVTKAAKTAQAETAVESLEIVETLETLETKEEHTEYQEEKKSHSVIGTLIATLFLLGIITTLMVITYKTVKIINDE